MVQSALELDDYIKTYSPEKIEAYKKKLIEYYEQKEFQFDWSAYYWPQLFLFWSIDEGVDFADENSIFMALAHACAWNVEMKTEITLDEFFGLLKDAQGSFSVIKNFDL